MESHLNTAAGVPKLGYMHPRARFTLPKGYI